MIKYKTTLTQEEKIEIQSIVDSIVDLYNDFYITKNNYRYYIKENLQLLYDSIQHGDKIIFSSEEGILFIHGWSDSSSRKYIKFLTKDVNSAKRLLQALEWNINDKLYTKLKKNNPIVKLLQDRNWTFFGSRGKEILLYKEGV